jgi:agmatine/peptidylarginine deiminase
MMKLVPAVLTSLAVLSACGQKASQGSKLDGHYENATATSVASFRGTQEVVPEYADSRGVIISLPYLTNFNKAEALAEVLRTDIEKLWIVVPSDYSDSVSGSDFTQLRRLAGSAFSKVQLVPQRLAGSLTIWARDWSPLTGKTADGANRLLDFNYYPNRQTDDFTAQSFVSALPYERVSVPVYNEGGNFMSNTDGVCMMTTRVTDANKMKSVAEDMILNAEQIKAYYGEYAGCKQVHIFPRIPYEGTGHIDMWAKFLDNKTVIVNEIRDEVLSLPNLQSAQKSRVQEVQTYLEARASEIAALGYNVIRIPMPAPVFNAGGSSMFRSYSNSLLVNGTAMVPRYLTPARADLGVNGNYVDANLLKAYENEVIAVYQKLGFTFKWVNSDDTIAIGGAIHCTTMQVPR